MHKALIVALALCAAPALAPPLSRAESVASNLAGSKPFTVKVDKVSAKKGQPVTAKVIFTAADGWHLSKDYPTSLKLQPPAGITAKKAELSKADAKLTDIEGRFEVVLTGTATGKKTVLGELRFAVSAATTNDPQKVPIAIEMDVQ